MTSAVPRWNIWASAYFYSENTPKLPPFSNSRHKNSPLTHMDISMRDEPMNNGEKEKKPSMLTEKLFCKIVLRGLVQMLLFRSNI